MSKLSAEIINCFPDIEEELLIRTLFEMNRYYDTFFKDYFSDYKKTSGNTLDSFQRKMVRNYFYYGNKNVLDELGINKFPEIKYSKEDLKTINDLTLEKLNLPSKNKIIQSIYSRINEINKFDEEKIKADKWLNLRKKNGDFDFISIKINQDFLKKYKNYEEKIYELITYAYDKLENYRYLSIVIEGKLILNKIDITWSLLSKVSIYMENFIQFKDKFFPFKKEKKIEELTEFLQNNNNLGNADYQSIAEEFYSAISTGYAFSDMLVSEDQNTKILIMKKIKLDETPIACPSCLEATGRGNSYPLMFLKSWECQNPNCPERSKSGRGKRFDEYGVYRYFKLVEDNKNNIISRDLYSSWRRDVFESGLDIYEMLFTYYSWDKEKILLINDTYDNKFKGRNIDCIDPDIIKQDLIIKYSELPIVKLLSEVLKNIKKPVKKKKITGNIELIKDDSIKGILSLEPGQIKYAITSPPYYNAREYSQWPTLIAYLIDMELNAKAIYDALSDDGVYLYNVGDIVDQDNVYVASQMSKRRIMLGFYSSLIFQIVGFKLCGNKMWDKGEVESKRNSTVNLTSGYVKYVNCYEHVLVLYKNAKYNKDDNKLYKIKPVYKINSKGENILGHTAPYPEELVELIHSYINDKKYLLDPFLGSGTTGIWARKNNINFIGYEINDKYYELAKGRIEKEEEE